MTRKNTIAKLYKNPLLWIIVIIIIIIVIIVIVYLKTKKKDHYYESLCNCDKFKFNSKLFSSNEPPINIPNPVSLGVYNPVNSSNYIAILNTRAPQSNMSSVDKNHKYIGLIKEGNVTKCQWGDFPSQFIFDWHAYKNKDGGNYAISFKDINDPNNSLIVGADSSIGVLLPSIVKTGTYYQPIWQIEKVNGKTDGIYIKIYTISDMTGSKSTYYWTVNPNAYYSCTDSYHISKVDDNTNFNLLDITIMDADFIGKDIITEFKLITI